MASYVWLCVPALVTVLLTSAAVWGSDQCQQYGNGCSTLGLPFFYKAAFTPACNKHDVCYGCGALYGISRSQCDTSFLTNMYAICSRRGRRRNLNPADPTSASGDRTKRSVCRATARNAYHAAVRVLGGKHYHSAGHTEYYCSQSATRNCL